MMLRRSLILIVYFMALHAHAERYALLVGNNSGKANLVPLKYVENDINCLQTILSDFCGFEKRHIAALYNGTPEDLNRLLSEFSAQTSQTKNNMFLFYFSGHADQATLKMGNSEYPLSALKEKLTSFPADIRIGIFDACQSGSFTQIKGGTLTEPFLFKDDGKTKGQVFLSSSSISENAQEFDVYRNSIFTFHFINALRGSGDLSGDGRLEASASLDGRGIVTVKQRDFLPIESNAAGKKGFSAAHHTIQRRNTVSLAFGYPELLDFEYQYAFDAFYVSVKPGIIVMLIYHSSVHDWNAYPSIRLGQDILKYRSLRIGSQLECAYFYTSWAEKNIIVEGSGNDYIAGDYYNEFKTDYLIFSFGPAIRYFLNRLELQLCVGFHTETSIVYSKTIINNNEKNEATVRETRFLPMARISAGFLF